MNKLNIFQRDYVESVIKPFIGKKLMLVKNGDIKPPLLLETGMEESFYIKLNSFGISFYVKESNSLNKQISQKFNEAILNLGIYAHSLDKLVSEEKLKDKRFGDNYVFNKIVEHLQTSLEVQLAFIYFTMIDNLEVSNNYFILNDLKFTITNY